MEGDCMGLMSRYIGLNILLVLSGNEILHFFLLLSLGFRGSPLQIRKPFVLPGAVVCKLRRTELIMVSSSPDCELLFAQFEKYFLSTEIILKNDFPQICSSIL